MTSLGNDLRYALRQMRKAPGFAFTAVMTLALGVGAATAMFSVLDAALLRPLPFAHQDRIVAVNTYSQSGYTQPFSYRDYVDTRQQMSTVAALSGYIPGDTTLQAGAGKPAVVRQIQTGDAFFDVFGVRPEFRNRGAAHVIGALFMSVAPEQLIWALNLLSVSEHAVRIRPACSR